MTPAARRVRLNHLCRLWFEASGPRRWVLARMVLSQIARHRWLMDQIPWDRFDLVSVDAAKEATGN